VNIYRARFSATCPNNGATIAYQLAIEAPFIIMAEAITAACTAAAECPKPYHENIADFLHSKLGGRQVITAHHHGVDIITVRG
jgi:poly(3-hydroxybutyrate) depolymerase